MIMYLWFTPVSVSAQLMRQIIEPPITQPLSCTVHCTVHCTPVLCQCTGVRCLDATCSRCWGPEPGSPQLPPSVATNVWAEITESCQSRSGAAGVRT